MNLAKPGSLSAICLNSVSVAGSTLYFVSNSVCLATITTGFTPNASIAWTTACVASAALSLIRRLLICKPITQENTLSALAVKKQEIQLVVCQPNPYLRKWVSDIQFFTVL